MGATHTARCSSSAPVRPNYCPLLCVCTGAGAVRVWARLRRPMAAAMPAGQPLMSAGQFWRRANFGDGPVLRNILIIEIKRSNRIH